MFRNIFTIASIFCGLFVSFGCSGSSETCFPVTGVVYLDGKIAPGVHLNFWPAEKSDKESRSRYASAVTGADGRYTMVSFSENGLPAGKYKVTFSRPVAKGKVSVDPKNKMNGSQESLPPKYVDPEITEITAQVSKDTHEFRFDLSSPGK